MSSASASLHAVLFDLGGVFLDWNPKYLYRKIFSSEEEVESFLENVLPFSWHENLDEGLDFQKAMAEKQIEHPHFHSEIGAYHSRWREMFREEFTDNVACLRALKKRSQVRVFALTNYPQDKFEWARCDYPFLNECFEGILVSGEEGLRKPDIRIFQRAEQRFDLRPEATLFIDDRKENVQAARRAGFLAEELRQPEGLPGLLKKWGLLGP